MAAGVGKTYRMLQEGHAEAEAGRDVVIGYLEAHRRPETIAQSVGLETVPRRRAEIPHARGEGGDDAKTVEEMDLPAVIRRAPSLALIDELAHTNPPGLEHGKRYEDVSDILDSGIDVFSTVNVQHIESLNDEVADLTGTRVKELVPDRIIGEADELVLIDITVEALLARLRAGKVYSLDLVDTALRNFFSGENLASLRELALRQVAQEVESKRGALPPTRRRDRVVIAGGPQAIGERLLALITPRPESQRLVRRAWRSAQRLGAELDLLWVKRPGRSLTSAESEQLEALRRLSSILGAHMLVEEGDDVVALATRVARERGSTYVLIGAPRRRPLLGRFAEPLPIRLVDSLPGVDVRIVADRALREVSEE